MTPAFIRVLLCVHPALIRGRCHSGYGPPRRCGPPRIDYASECGPTSADTVRHSGYDSTIENTTLSSEMTIVDAVRSTPVHYEFGSSRTKINHDRGGSYTGLLQYIVRVSYNFNNHDRERGGYCNH